MAKLKVIFRNSAKLGNFFRFKDSHPFAMQSLVIYNFQCTSCNARYVGKTSRHIATRIAEHKGVSSRTGKALTTAPYSAIREHAHKTGHSIKTENFSILAKASNKFDLTIQEDLLFQKHMPGLNNMLKPTDSLYT